MTENTDKDDRHILPLDGLRGLAILLVFIYHGEWGRTASHSALVRAFLHVASWGFTGVDLFFVLSGFLITRILLKTRDAENFYRVFYMRRVLRIFPLYYLAVILVFLILPKVSIHHPYLGLGATPIALHEQIWFWLNISNFRTAFNPFVVPLLTHFWSLAIEEQFYFVWPSMVRRLSDRALGWACMGGFLIPLTFRVSNVLPTFGAQDFYYRITPFHMEGLFAGAVLALLNAHGELNKCRSWFLVAIGTGSLGIGLQILFPQVAALHASLLTLWTLVYFGLVGLCLLGARRSFGLSAIFSYRPLRMMGDYSYFMYVFHIWVLLYLGTVGNLLVQGTRLRGTWIGRHGEFLHMLEMLVALAVLTAAAALSKRWIETPILGLKRHFSYGRRRHLTAA